MKPSGIRPRSEEQVNKLLELCVLLLYFTKEEVDTLRESEVKEEFVRIGRAWPGQHLRSRTQYKMLMGYGSAHI